MNYIRGHQTRNRMLRNKPYYEILDMGYDTSCWIWQANRTTSGYGLVSRAEAKSRLAHRFMYEKRHGTLPSNTSLHHLCKITLCVNPGHLQPLTPTEHVKAHGFSGERNPWAKLSNQQAAKIRSLYASGGQTYNSLALRFNVNRYTIWRILKNRSYTE